MNLLKNIWIVIRTPSWYIPLIILGLLSTGSGSAQLYVSLLSLLVMMSLALTALNIMGQNSFNPISIAKSIIFEPSKPGFYKKLIGAAFCIGLIFLLSGLMNSISAMVTYLVDSFGADENLLYTLILTTLAALFTACVLSFYSLKIRNSSTNENEPKVAEWGTKQAYWKESLWTLSLIAIALLPAAFMWNWAINVFASVFIPLLILQARFGPYNISSKLNHRPSISATELD